MARLSIKGICNLSLPPLRGLTKQSGVAAQSREGRVLGIHNKERNKVWSGSRKGEGEQKGQAGGEVTEKKERGWKEKLCGSQEFQNSLEDW